MLQRFVYSHIQVIVRLLGGQIDSIKLGIDIDNLKTLD